MEATDRRAFDKRMTDLLRISGKFFKPTPSDVKAYWLACERYPMTTVLAAMAQISRDHAAGHFTPGEVSRTCLEIQNAARRRKEFATEPAQERVYTAADDAAQAQAMADCRRMLAKAL